MDRNIILDEIKNDISSFKESKLKEVFDFVKFVKNREEIDPTIEILENKNFYKSVKKGIEQQKKGKVFRWKDVK